jgi:hypothetical protein
MTHNIVVANFNSVILTPHALNILIADGFENRKYEKILIESQGYVCDYFDDACKMPI